MYLEGKLFFIQILFLVHELCSKKNPCKLRAAQVRLSHGRLETDGRIEGQMMAAGSFVTWTHYSVRYKVTLGVNRRIRVGAPMCGHNSVHTDVGVRPCILASFRPPAPHPPLSAWMGCVHTDPSESARTSSFLPPYLLCLPCFTSAWTQALPCGHISMSTLIRLPPTPIPLAR